MWRSPAPAASPAPASPASASPAPASPSFAILAPHAPHHTLAEDPTLPSVYADATTIMVQHWGRLLHGELFATTRTIAWADAQRARLADHGRGAAGLLGRARER